MFKMRTLVTMTLGYAAGYVAGAKAGRPAYDRITAMFEQYAERLGVPTSSDGSQATATDLANQEIGDLRSGRSDGVPGRPDTGREHGATVVP